MVQNNVLWPLTVSPHIVPSPPPREAIKVTGTKLPPGLGPGLPVPSGLGVKGIVCPPVGGGTLIVTRAQLVINKRVTPPRMGSIVFDVL